MKKHLALGAFVAVLAAGCGGSSSGSLGPQETIQTWVDAIAAHDWDAACALETVEYQGLDCANSYDVNIAAFSAAAGEDVAADLTLDPESCGEQADGSYSCGAYGKYTRAVVTVTQVDGEWRVSSVG